MPPKAGNLEGANEIQKEMATVVGNPLKNDGIASIVGKWRWGPRSLFVVISADGWSRTTGYIGKWVEEESTTPERKYTIIWNEGAVTDDITVDKNGQRVRAKNTRGESFTAEKLQE